MSHLLPYLIAGGGVAIVIAAFGAWMAWCDLITSANGWIARLDDTPCDRP